MAIDQTLGETRHEPRDSSIGLDATLAPNAEVLQRARGSVKPGMQLGRYVVLEHLGAGGMGEVFTAWDPQLDRKLALKLLSSRSTGADTGGRARLLREAQAMAKLEHPNVVTIHDVGTFSGVGSREPLVFIAMEFIDGLSLRAWLSEQTREWRDILAVFRAAGEGLCAAHDAGLIHRDFKPDNVMVGHDGRVRVLDFGLARRGDDTSERSLRDTGPIDATPLGLSASSGDSLGSLTRTGVLVGTPAYMSPEQFTGALLDARSDQFSFCVALWEALCGERPFAAQHQLELVRAVQAGALRPFSRSDLPASLVTALTRGLAPAPPERWPDMPALLAALEPPQPRQRPWWLAGVALVGAAAIALAVSAPWRTPEPEVVDCSDAGARIGETWNGSVAARISANLEASGLSWAPRSAARVEAELDEWAAQWRDEAEQGCEAYHQRHELSAELFDLRMSCLDQRMTALSSLTQLLAESSPSAELVEAAAAAAAGLEAPTSCRRNDLRARTSEDPALAAEIAAINAQLDRVEQLQTLAQFERSNAAAIALDARIDASGRHELRSRQLMLRSLNHMLLDELEPALLTATRSVAEGRRSGLDDAALSGVIALARMTLLTGSPDESERWLELGEALSERLEDPWFRYELEKAHAFLATERKQDERALAHFERALDIATEHYGVESIERSWELSNFGSSLVLSAGSESSKRRARGLASWAEGIALSEKLLGPVHPFTLGPRLDRISVLMNDAGAREEALAELVELEALIPPAYAAEHRFRTKLARLRERADESPAAPATPAP